MSKLRQEEQAKNTAVQGRERLFPVRISPTEVRYMTEEQLADSITEDDVRRGLELAGSFNINMSEAELFERLNKMRYGSEPTPPIEMPE